MSDDATAKPWRILEGDCAVTLATLPAESVDAVVTDTPYGLSTLLDPPNLSRETLWRKLTEGASEAPIRTLMRSWLDSGDNPKMGGRGFMGKEWDALVPSPNAWRAVWRVMKPGAYCLAFGGTRTDDLIKMSLRFADFEIEDTLSWLYGQGFPKRVRLDLKIDQHFGKAGERPVLGVAGRSGSQRNCMSGDFTGGEYMAHGAATPGAARFVGWDRALRPGWEPVIVAVKPLRGTVAENALRYGTGGLHVDACRLPRGPITIVPGHQDNPRCHGVFARREEVTHTLGGYPANVAMDEETAAELDAMSGHLHGPGNLSNKNLPEDNPGYGGGWKPIPVTFHEAGGGGASRFFYVAKASSAERDAGLADLPPLTAGERCDREDGTAGVNGYAGTRGEGGRNVHPCVKPIALMRWLCRLVQPPGSHDPDISKRPVILDPFMGSGSTGMAALAEGARFIGCEMMPEYVEVARRRLQHAWALDRDDSEAPVRNDEAPGQRALF